jgi:hypothetical protein
MAPAIISVKMFNAKRGGAVTCHTSATFNLAQIFHVTIFSPPPFGSESQKQWH